MDYRQIIWLASYPKSGNTWVRCFLDAYFLGDVDINEMLASSSDDVAHLHQMSDGSDIAKLPIDIQQLTRPMAMARLVSMHNHTRKGTIPLFVKTHQPHMIANGIELLPECLTKATVYLVRDPRDVLPSYAKHMGCDLDQGLEWMQDKYRTLAGNENRIGELLSSWDAHVNSYINADTHNVMWVLYEDLLQDPEKYFTKILEHSGVTPDPERVKKAIEVTRLDNLKRQEEKKGFSESSPHAKNQFFGEGGSKNRAKLSPKHIHRIEKAFGRMMKRIGYLKQRVA